MEILTTQNIAPYLPYGLQVSAGNIENGLIYDVLGLSELMEQLIIITDTDDGQRLHMMPVEQYRLKPILRPLSDLVKNILIDAVRFIPLLKLFSISCGLEENHRIPKCDTYSSSEVMITRGYQQCLFGYHIPNNDVRLPFVISFHREDFLIKDNLLVTEDGLTEEKSLYNERRLVQVDNQYLLYSKLFEWHFDVFGLIEKGLALPIS